MMGAVVAQGIPVTNHGNPHFRWLTDSRTVIFALTPCKAINLPRIRGFSVHERHSILAVSIFTDGNISKKANPLRFRTIFLKSDSDDSLHLQAQFYIKD